jgi:hypothetical protein
MTPREVGHRLVRTLAVYAESSGLLGREAAPAPDLSPKPNAWMDRGAKVEAAPYLAAAGRIGANRLDIFALRDHHIGSPPRWNRDPKTGIEAPLVFGKLIDYRNPALVGDSKYLWEPNRHQHLVTLAQAFALSGAPGYLVTLREHLESWFIACPYRYGPNWTSALEAAMRLINWALAWQLLGGPASPLFAGAGGERLRASWLGSVYQHAQFVRGYFSRHSSANNHLIGEAAGLYHAALAWPYWPQARAWREEAKEILEREALAQNAADGVNREQAVAYQQFELDLLVLCLLAGKANGDWFSAAYESRIEAMLDYLCAIMDFGGNVPEFGDSDDGYVVRLAQDAGFCRYRSLLATGALLFRRADFKAAAGALDDKTRWLIGRDADARYAALHAERGRVPLRQAFAQGGYYILGCEFGTPAEIRLVADAGPLGYQAIAAHGHADALSFTLSVGGREFFVDPGTYAYHTQPEWRQYFRGTAAHNTVRIDGQDQSVQGGNFLWLHKARAGCSLWLSSPGRDLFEGWHDGYLRLEDPVLHRRFIGLEKADRRLCVEDMLEMRGEHEVELFFHCSEHCRVEAVEGGFVLSQADTTLVLRLPQAEGAQAQVHVASTAPIAGWVSREFDRKEPAPTIAWRARLAGNTTLRTEILAGQ